jgi:hypothetical protein
MHFSDLLGHISWTPYCSYFYVTAFSQLVALAASAVAWMLIILRFFRFVTTIIARVDVQTKLGPAVNLMILGKGFLGG